MKRIILKISGEALSGNDYKGINAEKVQEIASEIKALYETGITLGIIVGAGNIWRGRDAEKNHMEQAILLEKTLSAYARSAVSSKRI